MANQVQMLIYEGFLAADPEMRFTPNGKNVTNFRIGSNREYKDANGTVQKETIWLKITAWGKLAEITNQWCEKGSHVLVFGYLRAAEGGNPAVYELKSGGWGASYEVTAERVRILKGKSNPNGAKAPAGEISADEEELPY
jgi:single-strand DNA-binding protein